jgi:UDP-N-acetylmuramoyl-L-alanyl-D-glutamate--2,6-diaminopimelate ligase
MADAAVGIVALVDWLRALAPAAQLTSDSRLLAAGDVFLAYPGDSADGRDYIEAAVQRGAKAVLFDGDGGFAWDAALDVPHRAVAGLKQLAGPIANAWYDAPDAQMLVVAVTGTNGKTSCSQWLGRALSKQGEPTLVVGTLGTGMYRGGMAGTFSETGYTTPDAVLLQRRLAQARSSGARALAIEASSIGLDQGRLAGLHVDIALFTNFTRDHLDYHGDMAAYEAAKRRLFDWPGLRHAVLNLGDGPAPGCAPARERAGGGHHRLQHRWRYRRRHAGAACERHPFQQQRHGIPARDAARRNPGAHATCRPVQCQ